MGLLASLEDKGNIKMPQDVPSRGIMGMAGGADQMSSCAVWTSVTQTLCDCVLGTHLPGTAQKSFPSLYLFKFRPHSTAAKYNGKQAL